MTAFLVIVFGLVAIICIAVAYHRDQVSPRDDEWAESQIQWLHGESPVEHPVPRRPKPGPGTRTTTNGGS